MGLQFVLAERELLKLRTKPAAHDIYTAFLAGFPDSRLGIKPVGQSLWRYSH